MRKESVYSGVRQKDMVGNPLSTEMLFQQGGNCPENFVNVSISDGSVTKASPAKWSGIV